MRRFPILAAAALMVIGFLAQPGFSQTNPSPKTPNPSDQTKQDKKADKAKMKADKDATKHPRGQKTTTGQDAAYALSGKKGVEPASVPPPK